MQWTNYLQASNVSYEANEWFQITKNKLMLIQPPLRTTVEIIFLESRDKNGTQHIQIQ